ncbi:Polyadenylation and cleavage factor homolog 11 [Caenorhabditis elegans]|uniref:Polyadenylation and cleavage factor homolog 11 n=1 Tax=Caenorhabditis elegans TaxID=6239 RepID=PCF11_CAEEL|nr:Polyadenylation and cleavage factor homolog 11 [Caenorhabditis elegans]Q09345.1 RecName: Full=Polyadenylation and cleavage factor homolog 11 [Caenorhabditis elegans]CCD65870.1 Polyadenylation and cleavage factor homolog 11 [Caenorhabditis elegans]|eukprot:NP_498068.1 Polyadenylation and cleavage factor homolog 11 [Caenorhabditis elegans]
MESVESAARDYRETLAELRNNNKTQINLLTILADDFKKAAPQIVEVIERHLTTCSPSQKLLVMYVCDSILKNVKKPNDYDALFARKIVSMFEHAFRQGDERIRTSLYRIRVTWASTTLFMPSKLYELDMKINKLDPNWPISNPQTGRALRDDPQVMAPSQSRPAGNATSPAASTSTNRVFVNPKFIGSSTPGAASASKTVVEKTKSPGTVNKEKQVKKEPKQDPLDKLLPSSSASKTSSSPAGLKRKSAPSEHPNAPIRKKPQQPPKPQTAIDEDLRSISLTKKPPVPSAQDQDFRPKTLKPTSVIGSHAFAPVAAPIRPMIPVPPPVSVAPFVPAPPLSSAPPFQHPQQHHPQLPPPPVHQGMGRGYHHNSPPQDPAPIVPVQAPPPQQHLPAPENVYSSEQPKLDVPANNRIFVDGKAYEVMFVDDTAVIERGGAPHRIYFAGPPRNLVIDGIPHLLQFDTPTQIDILGSKHMVKFGAPSRELYIGGHPFKGQFGGPPIIATINGRRHEIRLTGSAPEVRIEPEPAYHLTHFLHKMREEKKIEIASEKPEKKEDWLSYLKNLRTRNILPAPARSPSSPRNQTPPPANLPIPGMNNAGQRGGYHNRHQPQQNARWGGANKQQNIPPPPSDPSPIGSGVEKRSAPPAAITDFNIRLLQIRYDSVVDALITKRADACKFCGMRLDDSQGKSKEWQDHMDWHVKQNLARHGSNNSAAVPYRQWYPSTSTWLTPRASDETNEQEADKPEEPLPGVASSGVKTKECSVCGEKFDEYYDDDEETWRLRDTVNVHGKIVHSACASDAARSLDNSSFFNDSDIKKEEPFD